MKSSTHLDSIVFQLTPTRTRCDLVIIANGKTEKIASGLLNPFLAHLKAAQDQIGKGGYSIVLEPKRGSDSAWFTKGTVERFVRFVSTPEILERVYTIESEIVQIEKAISIQNSGDTASHTVEGLAVKSEESIEGSKIAPNGNDEKAIVLYQPSSHESEEDRSSTMLEKNSKVQLVQVLETRKTVLQKEQGMAFARAVAAGFDIDNIASLHSFAECFGASRTMDACKRFVDLWKAKHESGQWVDVEATEAMSCRSELPSMNASGIMLLESNEKGSWPQGDAASEQNGASFATGPDVKPQADHKGQLSPGQFPHPMYPPWQMHSQANGLPMFPPPYPMPYYQNFPGNNPYFPPPPYPHLDDSALSHSGQKTRQRRHSMDNSSRDLSAEFDEDTDAETDEEDDSVRQKSRKKSGKSSRKTVVIRNINYIASAASAKQGSSDSDPEGNLNSDEEERKVKGEEVRKSKKKEAGDDGHWQAFQNFLLKDADESSNSAERGDMFAMEGRAQGKRRQAGSNHDQMLGYGKEVKSSDGRTDLQFVEVGARRVAYRRSSADANINSMINRQEKLTDVWDSSLDPVITNGFQVSNNSLGHQSHDMADDSLAILHKSRSLDQVPSSRTAIDMDYELPEDEEHDTTRHKRSQSNYEPDDLNLMMPDRVEYGSSGFDPALDFEMQAQQVNDASKLGGKNKEVTTDAKGGPKKGVKDQKVKAEKRSVVGTRREKPSKFSPSEDARARAEKLRAFKADLQKLKKEKEEEQLKRLEALKLERQKRIAARSGANPPQTPSPSQPTKKPLPKLSPASQKGSKFSDAEPGSSSPLQRSTLKFLSKASSPSPKPKPSPKPGKPNNDGNRLARSASSLSVRKEANGALTPESKVTMARIRRLSVPKRMPTTVTLEKTKSGGPSEVKLRTSKASPASSTLKKPAKEMVQKSNDKISDARPGGNSSRGNVTEGDDSTVVEKTVVMLEREKPNMQVTHSDEVKVKASVPTIVQSDPYNPGGKSEDEIAVPPPASPITVKEVDQESVEGPGKVKPSVRWNEKGPIYAEEIPQNTTHTQQTTVTEEPPYQAPYARVSSVEDPCMTNSDYTKAPPPHRTLSSETVPAYVETETSSAYVSDSQKTESVKISEVISANAKQQGKESSKGFRRLLKFGKKGSSSGSELGVVVESDKASTPEPSKDPSSDSSNEAFTLKNLLTQEEGSSAGTTPKKSSRTFSLLSPFRSKTSEKKTTPA